jgi:2-keto-4-pentenoate hydratase/2-oxohepta-3-ene-1,7-dioic acid hydratase in catechol pathway
MDSQSLQQVRNVFCVGRNYGLHAAELGNAVPDKPMLFSKPTHALVPADGRTVELPGDRGEVHFETELVIRIGSGCDRGAKAEEAIDGIALGIDFTLRDVQTELKQKGYPWLEAKGFRHSAPITAFRPFPGMEALEAADFRMLKNGKETQRGNVREMIFDLQTIIDFCIAHFGLGKGDIVFTGTPAGVGPVFDGDRFELLWGEETWGGFAVKLK